MKTLYLGSEIDLAHPPDEPGKLHASLAVVMLCIWAAGIDGDLQDVEITAIASSVSRMPLFEDTANEDLSTVISEAKRVFFSDVSSSPDWAIAVCNRSELSDAAYYMALDVIFSDGEIADNENRLAKILQVDLNLSEGFARSASDCMRAYYRTA